VLACKDIVDLMLLEKMGAGLAVSSWDVDQKLIKQLPMKSVARTKIYMSNCTDNYEEVEREYCIRLGLYEWVSRAEKRMLKIGNALSRYDSLVKYQWICKERDDPNEKEMKCTCLYQNPFSPHQNRIFPVQSRINNPNTRYRISGSKGWLSKPL
jgi:hypothetical protein